MGRYLSLLTGAIALVAGTSPASAGLIQLTIFGDSFNTETAELNTELNNFFVFSGSVDVVQSGTFGITCGGRCVDLNGTAGQSGTIASFQEIHLFGGTYTFTFLLSGNQRGGAADEVTLFFTGVNPQTGQQLLDVTLTLDSNAFFNEEKMEIEPIMEIDSRKFDVIVPEGFEIVGRVGLATDAGDSDNIGPILDGLSIVTFVIPEPSTLALFGSGLATLGLLRRRRCAS